MNIMGMELELLNEQLFDVTLLKKVDVKQKQTKQFNKLQCHSWITLHCQSPIMSHLLNKLMKHEGHCNFLSTTFILQSKQSARFWTDEGKTVHKTS